jgi:hypothetical protein
MAARRSALEYPDLGQQCQRKDVVGLATCLCRQVGIAHNTIDRACTSVQR